MTATRRTHRLLADERGFTLAVSMGLMLIASLVSIAAFQAARGDLLPSGESRDRKMAYAAAESGIAWYQTKLAADPNYWQKCDTGTSSGGTVRDPVTQPGVGGKASPAGPRWGKTLAGSPALYSIGLLPAAPATTCSTSNPASMLSTVDGTFRVRSTGFYRNEQRTVVAKFRRKRFLDFLYFTNFETLDPIVFGAGDSRNTTCAQYRAQRAGNNCTEIQFANADRVNGPLHTNDSILHCAGGTGPIFGRSTSDKIEVSGPAPGYYPSGGCSGTPNFVGTFAAAQPTLQLPPTNATLRGLAQGPYRFTGTTYIRFTNNGSMVVDTPGGNPQSMALPSNGVIYVDSGGSCPVSYPNNANYTDAAACGDVYVSGRTDRAVTIGAQRDIIVAPTSATLSTNAANQFNPATAGPSSTDADLLVAGDPGTTGPTITGDVQVGLIANRFVRVYHRVSGGDEASGVRNVRIDAAILSLLDSFLVDNWNQGDPTGRLTVNGAIAQRFRGPVGTGGASVSTGYIKDYWYDDRLKYRSPPYFLDPVNAAWTVSRQTEQVPSF